MLNACVSPPYTGVHVFVTYLLPCQCLILVGTISMYFDVLDHVFFIRQLLERKMGNSVL